MKSLALFCILMLFGVCSTYAQKIYTTEKDIFDIKELTFYGYDFSDWRLAETKRVDEDMRIYILSWIKMMKDRMTSEKLENWYVKEKVSINFAPTVDRDIATKKIILADYVDQKEADGYGLKNYWGTSLNGISSNYAASYRIKLNPNNENMFKRLIKRN